jgi:hypothetical protein
VTLRHVSLPHVRPHSGRAHPPAAVALGPKHPVARASAARSVLAWQLAATSVLLALCLPAALDRGGEALVVAAAALLVELALVCALARARACLRARSRDVIAAGGGDVYAAEIAAERERLSSPAHRERVAASLEHALYAAEHWHQLWPAARPLPGVRNLLACPELALEVAQLVRDPRTPVRGVALLDQLVGAGCASTLYGGPAAALVRDLARIRFLLLAGPASEECREGRALPIAVP